MALIQAKLEIAKWEKTLSSTEIRQLNYLVEDRKRTQKNVDTYVEDLKNWLKKFSRNREPLFQKGVIKPGRGRDVS